MEDRTLVGRTQVWSTTEQMAWLAKTIGDQTPQQLKMPYALWTLSIIRDVIKMRFKTTVSIATLSPDTTGMAARERTTVNDMFRSDGAP